jgi:hypothetical protein
MLLSIYGMIIGFLRINEIIMATKKKKDPCWSGYKKDGMKKKDGKSVPNCVKESKKDN